MLDAGIAEAKVPDISVRREVFALLALPAIGIIQLGKGESHLCSISDGMACFNAMSVSVGHQAASARCYLNDCFLRVGF